MSGDEAMLRPPQHRLFVNAKAISHLFARQHSAFPKAIVT
jgi:hypothetical protein